MRAFLKRVRWAAAGLAFAWKDEANFRVQTACAGLALGVLALCRAAPEWWALFALCIGGVLGLELVNTALESALDRLHPDADPLVGKAKDCAAGASLVFSLASAAVFAAFLVSRLAG